MNIFRLCENCGRLTDRDAMRCEAFPGGIPEEILRRDVWHWWHYPGDKGKTFFLADELAEDEEFLDVWHDILSALDQYPSYIESLKIRRMHRGGDG